MGESFIRNVERWLERPAVVLLGELDFFLAERGAVRLCRILLVGTSEAYVGPADDQRRPLPFGLRSTQGAVHRLEVVAVRELLHEPSVRPEALAAVFSKRQLGWTLDRDVIVVVNVDERV